MWSKELKKKKRISADNVQTFGPNSIHSSNSSGGSNSGPQYNQSTSSIPLHTTEQVNTSNLLNLNSSAAATARANRPSNGNNGSALSGNSFVSILRLTITITNNFFNFHFLF